MSLVGNLEDLGLGDILQIVSLSRKSGALVLTSRGREGKIVFADGLVTHAASSVFKENLGDLLLRRKLLDLPALKKSLLIQKYTDPTPRLGEVLVKNFGLTREVIETVVKDQLENIVYSFFGWTEGTFAFELGESRELDPTHLNPLQFCLDKGINPQWLAMEGSRIFDEKRHRGESLEASAREPLFDAKQLFAEVNAIAAGASPPATELLSAPAAPLLYNFRAELLKELGEDGATEAPRRGPESPGLHLLKGMLQELNNPNLGGGIILLVLRFASELMNRAVIFLVKEEEIVGLGQFGIEFNNELADARIRRMKIPRHESSIFQRVLQEQAASRVQLGTSRYDTYLREQLGGSVPEEIFLGPIISEGNVVAIIYGDNLPTKTSIGNTESFEIFLSQAGLAMEKALLERRLKTRNAH